MKIVKVLVPCLLLMVVAAHAQTSTGVTDEDLKKYAVTMDSVESMQTSLRELVAETVQTNTVMSVARYNELFKVQDDATKLQAANATAEEIAFLNQITELRKTSIANINATYQDLAKNYVGVKVFNQIRKSLQSDQQLKTRYENLAKEIDQKEKGG